MTPNYSWNVQAKADVPIGAVALARRSPPRSPIWALGPGEPVCCRGRCFS